MTQKFKLIREDEKVGVFIDEISFLKMLKIIKNRNAPLFKYFKKKYEDLTEKKINDETLKFA